MNRSWVRFPQAAQIRPPGSGWAFLYARVVLRCCLWPHGCCGRRRARPPARLGGLTSFGAAPRSPPVPSGPSGALHTSGAWCAGAWLGASARSPTRPRHRPRVPQSGSPDPQCGLACRAGILGRSAVCCYKRRQSDGFFAENQGFWTQIDDVCNMSTRKGVQTAPV